MNDDGWLQRLAWTGQITDVRDEHLTAGLPTTSTWRLLLDTTTVIRHKRSLQLQQLSSRYCTKYSLVLLERHTNTRLCYEHEVRLLSDYNTGGL